MTIFHVQYGATSRGMAITKHLREMRREKDIGRIIQLKVQQDQQERIVIMQMMETDWILMLKM